MPDVKNRCDGDVVCRCRNAFSTGSCDVFKFMGSYTMGIGLKAKGLDNMADVMCGDCPRGNEPRSLRPTQFYRLPLVPEDNIQSVSLDMLKTLREQRKTVVCMVSLFDQENHTLTITEIGIV